MLHALLASLAAAPATCAPPSGSALIVVTAADPVLRQEAAEVEPYLRRMIAASTSTRAPELTLLPAERGPQALRAEGGRAAREATVVESRIRLERAFDRFRELEDSVALERAAEVTAGLSAVTQSPDAIALLAEAHLLAGAIFLARGRLDAAQTRLRRALQLDPTIQAPSTRYAPRVRAELAALRGDPGPLSILSVQLDEPLRDAQVFIDGRRRGRAPVRLPDIPAGRHLVRVSAPGRLSFHTSVRVLAGEPTTVTARLPVDPEVEQIAQVATWLGSHDVRQDTLRLIARRAEADTIILAELRLSALRGPTATATRAVVLRLDDRPPQTTSLKSGPLKTSIDRLLRCAPGDRLLAPAPALARWAPGDELPAPFESPPGWWTRPWVWALFAVAVVGTAGALAATRQAEGPPDEVEITLIPRP